MSAPIITLSAAASSGSVAYGAASTGAVSAESFSHGASASQTRLRLTRRGRAVFGALVVLCVGVLLGAAALWGSTSASASSVTEAAATEFGYVVVQPGESLWGVATALDSSADPRDVIAEIVKLNQLGGSEVQAGQPIAVPLRYSDAPGVVSASELGL